MKPLKIRPASFRKDSKAPGFHDPDQARRRTGLKPGAACARLVNERVP